MQHFTRAIILKKTPFGDSDLIVTFFSREEGRLSGMARSARASRRRFGGALEPGSLVGLGYTESRAGQLVRIEEATVERAVVGVMKSLPRIGALARAIDLALAFLQERQPTPEKFDLLNRWLERISSRDPGPSEVVAFELKWLAQCGNQPHLDSCLGCGRPAKGTGRFAFGFDQGGLVCTKCIKSGGRTLSLRIADVDKLRALSQGDGRGVDGAAGPAVVVERYIQHILGHPLRSPLLSL